uniref:Rhomboid domain containing 1 n=1 Tax=Labrus bergylta TaxID=56723 RepID=A0A3Q3EAA7_9LABR
MRNRPRGSHLGLLLLASRCSRCLDNVPPVTLAVLDQCVPLPVPAAPLMKVMHRCSPDNTKQRLLLQYSANYRFCVIFTSFLYICCLFFSPSFNGWFIVFQGVLFALKVLNNHYNPGGVTYVMGFPVSNQYASWAELVLIHITSPGTSFVGHLAGILVGLLYTAGPLKAIMKKCAGLTFSLHQYCYRSTGGGYSGHHQYAPNDASPPSSSYSGGMTEEEQLEAAIRNSLNERGQTNQRGAPPPPPYGFHLPPEASAEDIRMRRLRRFDKRGDSG